ncbi:MAG: ribosomal protein L7/L12 [Akkermansiaceae bacterium]|nr:ribosomal protein L7/L12 [Armatimonadota bacterium]
MNFFNLFDKSQAQTPALHSTPAHANATHELETRIDRVCRAVGIDPAQVEARAGDSSPLPPEILEEVRNGRKIQAIKLYRDWSGTGLKEAKDAIDAIDAGGLPPGSPRLAILEAKLDAVLTKLESGR